jgi:hypothetical protein
LNWETSAGEKKEGTHHIEWVQAALVLGCSFVRIFCWKNLQGNNLVHLQAAAVKSCESCVAPQSDAHSMVCFDIIHNKFCCPAAAQDRRHQTPHGTAPPAAESNRLSDTSQAITTHALCNNGEREDEIDLH